MATPFNSDLLGDLARQRVVLFLGAGVSASATTKVGTRIAGWPAFLRTAAKKLDDVTRVQVEALIDGKDFLLACEIIQAYLSDEWEEVVTSEFGQIAAPSDLHKALLALDQRIIITTNFDKILEEAWTRDGGAITHYAKVIPKVDDRVFRVLKDHEGRYLLKIHGTIDDPSTLVFSRSEYIRMAFGNENYGNFLESLLLNYTFVYVGFSMDDPAITSLMELYTLRYPTSRPHYIFAAADTPDNIKDIYKRLRKLVVIPYDTADNHSELPKVVSALATESQTRLKQIVAASMARFAEDKGAI